MCARKFSNLQFNVSTVDEIIFVKKVEVVPLLHTNTSHAITREYECHHPLLL